MKPCPGSNRSDGKCKVKWHPRTEPLPPGGQVWASDGRVVWLIWADGKPVSEHATAVKYWTRGLIPAPPDADLTSEMEDIDCETLPREV